MMQKWLVRLEVARDDNGALSDQGIAELTARLTEDGSEPVLSRGDSGTVVVQMTIDARNDQSARSAAESTLRDRADTIWSALGLPPFTITFIEAKPEGG